MSGIPSIDVADFYDAHERHWDDAELLFEKDRLANADHLYGMSAECGLKALMQAFDMPVDPERKDPRLRKDRVHLDGNLWQRYESYRSGHLSGPRYALPPQDYFRCWRINQRYANRGAFTRERVERHRTGAMRVRELVRRARLEGLL